ncbi:uncharacterized protein LOC131431270 [Malaya genurostris]|uniref:uncharacterized protein LOC131431270 n=1 Tax=Malaya genurostris TaxID=325434 RepID=UPI0026F3A113|nr:uncharacterized protein LOC131431270 [Malaya genurostris]
MSFYDPDRRVWSGPRIASSFDPKRGLGEVLLDLLSRNPDKLVQIDADTGRTLSRDQLKLRAIRIAQHLREEFDLSGVNDIVTIAASSSENLTPVAIALQLLAVPYNTLFPNFTVDEMAHMMSKTQSRLAFCDAWNYVTVRDAAQSAVKGEVNFFILDGSVDGVPSVDELLKETGRENEFQPAKVNDPSKTIYSIFCSSGTTGPPKGICLSHSNKINSFLMPIYRDYVYLAIGSIHWISVAFTHDMAIFYDSVVVITRKPFSEDLFFDLIEKYRINGLNGPPVFAHALARHPRAKSADLSSLKLWGIGGYFVSDDIRDAVDALLPGGKSYTIYASTECALIAADLLQRKRGAVGPVLSNLEIKIVDDEGRSLGVGEQGELWIKRSPPFLGYFKNEEATAAVLDAEGWFQSGDLGYFDDEGFLYLVDRKGDLFKFRNDSVSPQQLEDIIVQMEGVKKVCVVGIPTDDRREELPTAVVVRDEGSTISEQAIVQFVEERVMDHKRLRGGVYFVDEMPFTSKGNVKRKTVRKMIMDQEIK